MPTCRVCNRRYIFDHEQGYSIDLCGPMCDGIEAGRASSEKEIERLRGLLVDSCDDWETSVTHADTIKWKPLEQIAWYRAQAKESECNTSTPNSASASP